MHRTRWSEHTHTSAPPTVVDRLRARHDAELAEARTLAYQDGAIHGFLWGAASSLLGLLFLSGIFAELLLRVTGALWLLVSLFGARS